MTTLPQYIGFNGHVDEVAWGLFHEALGDGIVNDLGGSGSSAFGVTGRSSSDRTFAVRLGEFRLRGVHYVPDTTSVTLTVPAIASGSFRVDRVVLRLDFTAKTATVAVKQGAATTGTPVPQALSRDPGGIWEVGLWLITGGIGAAGTLTFTDQRRWVPPNLYVPSVAALSETSDLPTGARILEAGTGCEWRVGHPGGVTELVNLDQPNWTGLGLATLPAGSPALSGRDGPPQYRLRRGDVQLQGGITVASGNVPTNTVLTTLPTGACPPVTKRFRVASSAPEGAQLEIRPDGTMRLSTTPTPCTWFNLDGVPPFQAGN